MNGFGFRPVEPNGINRLFDLSERKGQHRGRLMRQCEQPDAGFTCRLVFGSETEETRNKDAKGVSVRLARHHADDRLLPLPDLALDYSKRGSDLVLAHGRRRARKTFGECNQPIGQTCGKMLLWLTLRQPLLTSPLCLALFSFLPDARLFVKSSTLQFAEESFSCKFFLRNFEGFFNVIIEDFDFHSFRLCAFPGDACTGFCSVPA